MHLSFICHHGFTDSARRGLQLGCSTPPCSRAPLAPIRAPRKPGNSWSVLATHGPERLQLHACSQNTIASCLHLSCPCKLHT